MDRKFAQPTPQEGVENEADSKTGSPRISTPRNPGIILNIKKSFYHNVVEPLVSSKNPPGFDARGVAFGLIIGFLAPIGTHLIALGLLRVVSRFHLGIAFAFTFVTNPLNAIPVYYAYYYMGSLILGDPEILEFERFRSLLSPLLDRTYFWEAASAFGTLGYEILLRWAVSAVILSVVFGTLGYVITYRIQAKRCRRAAARMGINYEHYLEQLKRNAQTNSDGVRNRNENMKAL
ncbi:MAG: DUF2062 domain-containing protein [Desulfomonile tiedjei]|uniref:DUF2062 domain-containing protein n=1 Tax=Desulfomonile tiedjei TaxID=2358 RepID=A0A9D6UZ07_9BACT|nr:DUF2062 domain-containing protein [Desulfomonile tiedjei]